jgi:hypothetical protein
MLNLLDSGALLTGQVEPLSPEEEAARLADKQSAPGWAPAIRSYGDLNYWATDEQKEIFRQWLRYSSPNYFDLRNEPGVSPTWVPTGWLTGNRYTWSYIDRALREGRANISLDAIMRIVLRVHDRMPVPFNWNHKGAAWIQKHILTRLDLSSANLEFTAFKVALQVQQNKPGVLEAARALGVRDDISDVNMGGAVAEQISQLATSQFLTVPQVVEIFGEVQGAGSILSEFWNDAKDWFNNVVVKNIGRAMVAVGEAILKARDDIPFLGTFFLDPLGISLTAEALRQLGEVAVHLDFTVMHERGLLRELGTHWSALGRALIVAGGIVAQTGLGLPFGAILIAAGVLFTFAGAVISREAAVREAQSRARAVEEEYKLKRDELYTDCKAALEADFGVEPDSVPRDPDKCVAMHMQLAQEQNPESGKKVLAAGGPQGGAGFGAIALIGGGLLGLFLLTRK